MEDSKKFIWAGMMLGTFVGGFVPTLFGGSEFSVASVIWSAVGGFIGIWAGFKMSQ